MATAGDRGPLDGGADALLPRGLGAVVEGALAADGVFEATQVIVKHDENYEAPGARRSAVGPRFDPGADE